MRYIEGRCPRPGLVFVTGIALTFIYKNIVGKERACKRITERQRRARNVLIFVAILRQYLLVPPSPEVWPNER